ncbi:uncharacterized protein V1513DRAFT_455492 [Lipomyces chichibuensis]|uniref:uncharacterized protein n=1 Tax=Lipomyces chichibuensis TaxID=1546026 RepID=UPI003343E80E
MNQIYLQCCNIYLQKWDTANIYSSGQSEQIIAAAIKKYSIPRNDHDQMFSSGRQT